MKLLSTVVMMAFCGLLLAATETKKKATDQDQIQGTWSVVSGESNKPPIEEIIKHVKLTFKGDMVTTKFKDGSRTGTFKLDAAKDPKEITVTMKSLKKNKDTGKDKVAKDINANDVSRGIYQLQGDTLKICMGDPGQPWPKNFSFKQDFKCQCTLVNLKRDKK
jgi:uncharacterized protein (TIGR03067 family)